MFDIRKHVPKTGFILLSVLFVYVLLSTGLYVPHCHEDGDCHSHHEDCPFCQFLVTVVCVTPDIVIPVTRAEVVDSCVIVPEEIILASVIKFYQSRSPPFSLFVEII